MHRRELLKSIIFTLAAAAGAMAQERRGDQHEEHRPDYHFRQDDKQRLREHYGDIAHVDREHREHFVVGGRLPGDWRHHIHTVPEAVIHELPPIPAGYEVSYYDGYAVVYDPRTGYILETLDLAD